MRDQASGLRSMMSGARARSTSAPTSAAAFVIGSGKGGVGKSVLSVLLASALAERGARVLLLDGAQNQGNLHVLLGVRPAETLESVASGEIEPEQLVMPVAERLWLVPGDSGTEALYSLTAVDRARLHHRLSRLYDGFDAVIVDSGPGIESVVRATLRAQRLVVVTVPEPAALSDAYALMKIVNLQIPSLAIDVLVNRATSEDEAQAAFERLSLAAQRFLNRDVRYAGAVPEDEALRRVVRHPGAILKESPAAIGDVIERLTAPAPPAAQGLVP